jgi:cell division transport system permease protein
MLRPLAPIVPPLNVSGRALMVVIAIMSFLCAVTLGAVTMVQEKAETWQGDVSREITIQIKPTDDIDIEATLLEVRDLTLSFPGALTAQIVDRSSTARLLEPWLGEGFDMDELPVPRLVIVTIDETAPPDFTAMRQALAESAPSASLDDHRAWADRLISMARITVLWVSAYLR